MSISKENVEAAYQRNASNYDLAVKICYPLIGLHIDEYRKRAVDYLNLKSGDTVVDIGCGTGLCFPLLMDRIGPAGHLIGVDISSEMLSRAKIMVENSDWANVQLIHSDIAKYKFPKGINGAISTGVFGYIKESREVIERVSQVLVNDSPLVIIDGKYPMNWPKWIFNIFVKLCSPFGVNEDYFKADTWKIIEELFEETTFEEMYGGLLYISSGRRAKVSI